MKGLNRATIIGNLGQDPETRYGTDGTEIVTLSIATNEVWKDKSGEKKEKVEWHRVVLFGKTAEIAGQYLTKGSPVFIEGRLQTRKWTDKQNIDRYTTEIIGQNIILLGGGGGSRRETPPDTQEEFIPGTTHKRAAPDDRPIEEIEDDIPF